VVLILILINVEFYGVVLQGGWTNFAMSAWLVLGFYWLLTQVFWFPMILELKNEKVFFALRHALAMVIITPAFSLTVGVGMAILSILCIVLSVPAVLVMGSLLLLIANHATRSRLAFVKKEPYKPGMDLEEQKRAR
jgi:fatty acid desaturase